MKICVIDTETDGTADGSNVIEIAAAVYDTAHRTTLWQMASIVPGLPIIENHAQHINGISPELFPLTDGFYDPFQEVSHYVELCDAIMAHNAEFDRRMVNGRLPDKPWIDSQRQIKFPRAGKSQKLIHLAADHGIIVAGAHRAMADVMLLVALLRVTPDIETQVTYQIERMKEPQALYAALVSFEQKDLAKNLGFSWNKPVKRWEKTLTDAEVAAAQSSGKFPFQIQKIA